MDAGIGPSEFEARPLARPAASIASPLLLGLFMLMLAIFIILVSLSTVAEHRARAVIQGMATTFKSAAAVVNFVPPLGLDPEAPGTGNFPELGRLVQAAIPGARAETPPAAARLRLAVPSAALFGKGRSAALAPDGRNLLGELARGIAARPQGLRYDVEFLVGRGRVGDWPLAAARGAAVAETLIAAGAPRDSVAIGILAGAVEQASFVFYVRPANDGRLDFDAIELRERGAGR